MRVICPSAHSLDYNTNRLLYNHSKPHTCIPLISFYHQENFKKLGEAVNGPAAKIERLDINNFYGSGFNLSVKTQLPPLMAGLPIPFGLRDPIFKIGSSYANDMVSISVSDMYFKLSENVPVDTNAQIQFTSTQLMHFYINQILENDPLTGDLVISSDLNVVILGLLWYRGLHVEKVISIKEWKYKSAADPHVQSTASFKIPPEIATEGQINSLIRNKYEKKDLISSGDDLPEVAWKKFDIKMDDYGMNFNFNFEMENPTIATIAIPDISFGVGIKYQNLCVIRISKIVLTHGLNSMNMNLNIIFPEDELNVDRNAVLGNLLGGSSVAINGPITLSGTTFLQEITQDLSFEIHATENPKDSNGNQNNISKFSAELMKNLKAAVSLKANSIQIPITLSIPKFLPIPQEIDFPLTTSFGVIGTTVEALSMKIHPIKVLTDEFTTNVTTAFEIIPVNSEEAAISLASSINPILSATPQNSSIKIGDLKFSTNDRALAWSTRLFNDQSITIPLQPICLTCETAPSPAEKLNLPSIQAKHVGLTQLTTDSGFEIDAVVSHSELPIDLNLELGYFGMNLDIMRNDFVKFDLPNGIDIGKSEAQIELKSRIIISHEASVGSRLENAISSISGKSQETVIAGITNLLLGNTQDDLIQTFSKIIVELDVSKLSNKLPSLNSNDASVKKTLATLKSADLSVSSAHHVQADFQADVHGLDNININIGTLSLDAGLKDAKLMSLKVNPIILQPNIPFDLSLFLDITSGNPNLSQRVSKLANSFLKSHDKTDESFAISGLVLSPSGVSTGPAVIDQFKNVIFNIPIPEPQSITANSDSPPLVDISKISENYKTKLALSASSMIFDTKPGSTLELLANINYRNDLPISVKLPFVKTSIHLNDVSLIDPSINGLLLEHGSKSMSPKAVLFFQQSDSTIQNHVAKLVNQLEKNEIPDAKLLIKGLLFGASENDKNDLFSLVEIDISDMLKTIKMPDLNTLISGSSNNANSNQDLLIHQIMIKALPKKMINVVTQIDLKLGSSVTANIGTIGAGLLVSNSQMLHASVNGLNVSSGNEISKLHLNSMIEFDESKETPDKVSELVQNINSGKSIGSSIALDQFEIGFSESDKIMTFSKVVIPIPSDALLNKFQKQNSPSTSSNMPSIPVDPKKLAVVFGSGKTISVGALVSTKLPFPVEVSIPFFDTELEVDSTPAIHTRLANILVSDEDSQQNISIESEFKIYDSDKLTDKIGAISESLLHGHNTEKSLGIKGVRLGVSPEDSILSFSKINLNVAIDTLLSSSEKKGKFMSAISQAYISAIKVGAVDIRTVSDKTIDVSADFGFTNNVEFTLDGLGHLAGAASIDSVSVIEAKMSGLHVGKGTNDIKIHAAMKFPQSNEGRIKIATMVNDVQLKHNLTQILGCTGIEFGFSGDDYIKVLSKARIGVPVSKLLEKSPALPNPDHIDPKSILQNLVVRKNHVDFSKTGLVLIDVDLSLSNMTLPISADIGYISTNTELEDNGLADFAVNNLKISQDNNQVNFQCQVEISLHNGEQIQNPIASIVKQVQDNGIHNVKTSGKVLEFKIGKSKSDTIDSFSLLNVKGNPFSLVPPEMMQMVNSFSKPEEPPLFKLDIVYAEVLDPNRLGADVFGTLNGKIPISLNLPYFRLAGQWFDQPFVEIEANNFMIDNGNVTCNGVMTQYRNMAGAEELAVVVGNVLFHRSQNITAKMDIHGVRFGSSKDSYFDLLQKVDVVTPLKSAMEGITEVVNRKETLIELVEMKSSLTPTGIMASFVGNPFPSIFPFAAKPGAGAICKIGYGPNRDIIVNIVYSDIVFFPGKPFTGKSDIQVLMPTILEPLTHAVPRLFAWENYDQNVTVGWPQLTAGDPYNPSILFTPLDHIYMDAPELYLWTPITFEPKLVNPFTNGLGMDINVYINNPGPLYADFGILKTTLYHKDKVVGTIVNPESAIIKNVAHGGDKFGVNKLVLQVRIGLSKNPIKAWEELMDMIHNLKDYKIDIEASSTEYGRIEWLTTIFQHLGDDLKGQIFPTLIAMLHHVKFKIGPWSLSPPQKFIDAAERILSKWPKTHFKFMPTESQVNNSSFLAFDHAKNWINPMTNETGNAINSDSESHYDSSEMITGSVPIAA